MTVAADANGTVAGRFTIPEGINPGTKPVRFVGGFGSVATALYTASGQVIETTYQREITEIYQPPPAPRPVIVADSVHTTRKGIPITVPAAGLLVGAMSQSGGTVALGAYSQPSNGAAVANDDGSFTYTPNPDFVGVDAFTFVVGDGVGGNGSACVFITVLATQLPPVARDDNWSTVMNVPVAANVVTNDSSPDGRPIHLISNTDPAHGQVSTTSSGLITYTPTTGFTGVDSFGYTISDDRGLVASATVWVHVDAPPIKAVDDEVNLNQLWGNAPEHSRQSNINGKPFETVPINVLANDTKPAGTVVVAVTQPVGHPSLYSPEVVIVGGGASIEYRVNTYPANFANNGVHFSIDDTFTYTIQSPDGARSTARVHVYANMIYIDPLAQTFALDQPTQLFGVDVWVAEKGYSPLAIELREVVYGIPDQQPLVRGALALADIVEGTWNRILFPVPVTVVDNKNYAFVAMCDDAVTALASAEIGRYDLDAGEWVTSQPYSIGVMLTSSNNATWTPHQNTDLAFRLLTKSFEVAARRVELGTVALNGDTDFLVAANVDIPAPGCAVDFELAMPDGSLPVVSAHQPLALSTAQTGTLTVTAILTGTEAFTPTLYPDVTVLHGPIGTTGSYVSRAMPAGPDSRVRCIYEARLPAGSSVDVTLREAVTGVPGYTAVAMPVIATATLDNGMVEYTRELSGVNADTVQVEMLENGTAAARPAIQNFRAMVM